MQTSPHPLDPLLSRQSVGALEAPAPEGAELDLILDAGLRAPDHGRLRPWSGARIRPRHPVPEIEQMLSAGAAAMNMLNAIHMLGYGGMWVTGANTYDPRVNAALGFQAPSQLVGFLAVGTPKTTTSAERPERLAHVVEWSGPLNH